MSKRPQRSPWLLLCLLLILVPASFSHAQASGSAPVEKQLPADVRAYKAAQAVVDPEKRLAAMRSFVKEYPKSSQVSDAQSEILKVLLDNFPERTVEIEKQAKLTVKGSGKGYVAEVLAEAGTNGVDLKLAEKFAKEEVAHLGEASYDKETLASYAKYKQTPPKPEALHKGYVNDRAEALAVLARRLPSRKQVDPGGRFDFGGLYPRSAGRRCKLPARPPGAARSSGWAGSRFLRAGPTGGCDLDRGPKEDDGALPRSPRRQRRGLRRRDGRALCAALFLAFSGRQALNKGCPSHRASGTVYGFRLQCLCWRRSFDRSCARCISAKRGGGADL